MNNSHDPLSVLHGDELPVQPDPAFAARLRARLESAVSLPNRTQGVVMSGTDHRHRRTQRARGRTRRVRSPAARRAAVPVSRERA